VVVAYRDCHLLTFVIAEHSARAIAMAKDSDTVYPKKYWWLVLMVLPVALALLQYQPWKTTGRSSTAAEGGITGNQFLGPAVVGNVSVVVHEAAKVGAVLDPAVIEKLKEAAALSRASQHEAAAAKVEEVRASSDLVAALPSIQNNLGLEYLAAGKTDRARQAFEAALAKDATNQTALAGLGQLPDAGLKGLKVVNSSSGHAETIADGYPSTGWRTGANFPQTIVLELPNESTIAEVAFNNAPQWEPNGSAKEIEISISSQSATSGFEIAAKAVLAQGEIGQGIRINPSKRGRWIKVRILSNYGNTDHTELGDVEVIGKPRVG
jgi:tetratricopeptide (TPR) repeat protein